MKRKRIVYKVFKLDGGAKTLHSWFAPVGCSQEYSRHKINKPLVPGSLMFCFASKKRALSYNSLVSGKVVYKCEATGVRPVTVRLDVARRFKEVKSFWALPDEATRMVRFLCGYRATTAGCRGCETVKLIKRIK